MRARDPYHIALRALAGFAGAGRFGWGEALAAANLAKELQLSPTPVREALARLAGEGVLEHRPGRGYFAPSPTPSDIVQLYNLHLRLVSWALDRAGPAGEAPEAARTVASEDVIWWPVEALYGAIVLAAGDDVLTWTYRRISTRLRPIRVVEAVVQPADAVQIAHQERLFARGRIAELRPEVDAYHHGRIAAAQAVFAMMRRSGQSIEQI